MKHLTDKQVLDLEKVYCDNLGPGIHGSRSSIEALVKAHDRIRTESVDDDLVGRCAAKIERLLPNDGARPLVAYDIARAVLQEASGAMGGDLSDVTNEELDVAVDAYNEEDGAVTSTRSLRACVNAVLASRRQRMVMSGGLEHKPDPAKEKFLIGVDLAHGDDCTAYYKTSANGTVTAITREEYERGREGAKAAEHCQTEPEEQDAYQITAETYELWKPRPTTRDPLWPQYGSKHDPREHGKGLQAIALKELDRPLSSKPTHTASFGIDIYDEDP